MCLDTLTDELICPHCGSLPSNRTDESRGNLLRLAREELHVAQRVMAGEMGISPQFLCDLEAGHRHWTSSLVNRYLGILRSVQTGEGS